MSVPEDSLPESPPDQQTPRRCRVRYSVRWFSSKGAFLILLWTFLVNSAHGIPAWFDIIATWTNIFKPDNTKYGTLLFFTVVIVSAVLSGWLADGVLGKYRVVKMGNFVLFLSLVVVCLFHLFYPSHTWLKVSLGFSFIGLAGVMTVIVNLFQLGLDQMPDASSNNITSYIVWFVVSIAAGCWINQLVLVLSTNVLNASYAMICRLLPVLCVSIVLCSDFLLTPKWLIKEPKSPHSLKVIYRVLRYAKKHKSPVNRSALTYWEEDLPSRIDLGKSKYGGPFTTEQVENVKTFLRILVLSIPLWINLMALPNKTPFIIKQENKTSANNTLPRLMQSMVITSNFGVIVILLTYEFAIYPFLPKIPSTLKRIGTASFLLVLVSIAYLLLSIFKVRIGDPSGWLDAGQEMYIFVLMTVFATAAVEFVCAQSPGDMKGLLNGYIFSIILLSRTMGEMVTGLFKENCKEDYERTIILCAITHSSLFTVLSLVGFVSHILLSRWYKRRKREDIIATQQWVEEVYDRYLSTDNNNNSNFSGIEHNNSYFSESQWSTVSLL